MRKLCDQTLGRGRRERVKLLNVAWKLFKPALSHPRAPRLRQGRLRAVSTLEAGWRLLLSVWPFLPSLTALLSPCAGALLGWTRSTGATPILGQRRPDPFCCEAPLESAAGLAMPVKYTAPVAVREEKTRFFLSPCAYSSSPRPPSAPLRRTGTRPRSAQGTSHRVPPRGDSEPAQHWQETSIHWDTKGNGFPKILVSHWNSPNGRTPRTQAGQDALLVLLLCYIH